MNTINAGDPSANNMITRQVMQKKHESSGTIFDKLTKRTTQLTVKNPLNNVLTNDQLFRYYIKEVEPKLSQSNDNFQGLPNTTPEVECIFFCFFFVLVHACSSSQSDQKKRKTQ